MQAASLPLFAFGAMLWSGDAQAAAVPIGVTVDSRRPIFTVSPQFVSYTVDSASLCSRGWTFPANVDAVTTARVRLLSHPGLVIRFGGTSADNEQYDGPAAPLLPRLPEVAAGSLGRDGCNITAQKWRQLAAFASSVNASLVYGINSLLRVGANAAAPIDLRNADALFDLAASDAPTQRVLLGFELGNEPLAWSQQHYTNLTAAQHASDFVSLRDDLPHHFQHWARPIPLVLGPDVFGLTKRGGAAIEYLNEFLYAKPRVDIVTVHLYPLLDLGNVTAADFRNESLLDVSQNSARAARALVDKTLGKHVSLWIGEGSPSWKVQCDHGCGALAQNITFELVYLDMLGSFAASGVAVFARQCLNSVINPGNDVLPGFWTGLLWKLLMGEQVLNATVVAGAGVRAYAHTASTSLAADAADVALMLLNLNVVSTTVTLALHCTTGVRYTLENGPISSDGRSTLLLNGKLLRFRDQQIDLPPIQGEPTNCTSLNLPPSSATWILLKMQMVRL